MELKDIFNCIGVPELTGVVILLLTIIQITPIEINPWSAIAKVIGRALNVEIMEKLKETEADNVRYRIIRFDDEIRHNIEHTEEHFNQIIKDVDKYEEYCNTHPKYANNKAKIAIHNIEKTYEKCKHNNSFLI
jgi:excinuclease UvrABC helicase subunit UvrB